MCVCDEQYCCVFLQAEWKLEKSSVPAGWPTLGHIEIQNFGLRYRQDLELAIQDINVTIEGGEKVGSAPNSIFIVNTN